MQSNSSLSSQIERGHIFFDIYKDMRKECQCQIQVHANSGQILRKKTNPQHFQFIPQHFHVTSKSAVFKRKVVLSLPFLKPFGNAWHWRSLCVSLQISKKLRPRSVGRKKMQRKLKFVLVIANWTRSHFFRYLQGHAERMSMPNSSTRKQRTNIEEKNQSAAFSVYSAAFSCHVEVRGFQTESCLEPPSWASLFWSHSETGKRQM